MKLQFTKPFTALYVKLDRKMQDRADKQLGILLENPQHPSLRLHKMQGQPNLWEISVSMKCRIIFSIVGDKYVLRRIGPHDILHKP